jgi:hypothetical protein
MDPNNMAAILVNNILNEEDIARQHSPLNNSIFAELQQMLETIRDKDLVNNLLFDVMALGHYIGPRLSKYAQVSQDKVDLRTYPSVTTVVKAFIAGNFIFYNNKKCIIKKLNKASLNDASSIKITWQIQKIIRTTMQSRSLPTWQTLLYVPCVVLCNWFYALVSFLSLTICP